MRRAGPPSRATFIAGVEHVRRQEERQSVLGGGRVIMGDEFPDRLFRRIQRITTFW